VLYASSPSPGGSVTLLLKTLLWLFAFSFVMKFGLMVQISQLWQFLLLLFPLLVTECKQPEQGFQQQGNAAAR
jgi:hypothetical protein